MEEKKESEEKPVEGKAEEKPEPEPEKPALITEATAAAERLEKANEVQSNLLDRQEKLLAEQKLGGRSSGQPVTEPEEQSNADYAKDVVAGKHNDPRKEK